MEITTEKLQEIVEHPQHYSRRAGVECIEIAQTFNFNLGNVIKYIWRAGEKPNTPEIVDLYKAKKYIEFEIARLELEEVKNKIVTENPW